MGLKMKKKIEIAFTFEEEEAGDILELTIKAVLRSSLKFGNIQHFEVKSYES